MNELQATKAGQGSGTETTAHLVSVPDPSVDHFPCCKYFIIKVLDEVWGQDCGTIIATANGSTAGMQFTLESSI